MTSTLEDLFLTDAKAEEDGVWVELGDMKFLIRSFSCKAAVDLREKLQRPYVAILRTPNGKIPEKKADEINLRVLAGGILADWKVPSGTDEDGNIIYEPFSQEAAYAKMEKMPRFASWVAQQAIDAQNFQNADQHDAIKN